MSRHIVVAGGAGFIGSHLVDLLLESGSRVTVLDNFVTGRHVNIAHLAGKIRVVDVDINSDLSKISELSEPIDEIYNMASPASPIDFTKMPTFILQTSSVGHRNLLELARKTKARILFASTSEVYGDPLVHPQTEAYFGNVNPIGPRGCYDEAKRFGEALTMAYHREHNVETRIVRIFNTYGERMRPNDGRIIPNFFVQALQKEPLSIYGDGSQTRSFCYARDLVEGIVALMASDERRPVNVGNPTEKTVREMADLINALTGNKAGLKALPLPENDPLQRKPDITRAKDILKWSPRVSLEDGLLRTLAYFKDAVASSESRIETPTLKN
jgi:dTDP-glucose 4,6-dehydratase